MQRVADVVVVIADPGSLGEVDFAFFGVDAVLGQQKRNAALEFDHGAEQSGVTGGNGVHGAHRRQLAGDFSQNEQRRVHGAHGPEIIDERRLGAALAILFGDVVIRGAAVEKIRAVDTALLAQPRERVQQISHRHVAQRAH